MKACRACCLITTSPPNPFVTETTALKITSAAMAPLAPTSGHGECVPTGKGALMPKTPAAPSAWNGTASTPTAPCHPCRRACRWAKTTCIPTCSTASGLPASHSILMTTNCRPTCAATPRKSWGSPARTPKLSSANKGVCSTKRWWPPGHFASRTSTMPSAARWMYGWRSKMARYRPLRSNLPAFLTSHGPAACVSKWRRAGRPTCKRAMTATYSVLASFPGGSATAGHCLAGPSPTTTTALFQWVLAAT